MPSLDIASLPENGALKTAHYRPSGTYISPTIAAAPPLFPCLIAGWRDERVQATGDTVIRTPTRFARRVRLAAAKPPAAGTAFTVPANLRNPATYFHLEFRIVEG
jgi:hypothetical protein